MNLGPIEFKARTNNLTLLVVMVAMAAMLLLGVGAAVTGVQAGSTSQTVGGVLWVALIGTGLVGVWRSRTTVEVYAQGLIHCQRGERVAVRWSDIQGATLTTQTVVVNFVPVRYYSLSIVSSSRVVDISSQVIKNFPALRRAVERGLRQYGKSLQHESV